MTRTSTPRSLPPQRLQALALALALVVTGIASVQAAPASAPADDLVAAAAAAGVASNAAPQNTPSDTPASAAPDVAVQDAPVTQEVTPADPAADAATATTQQTAPATAPADAPLSAPVVDDDDAVDDPWQPFNRRVHRFNVRFDDAIAKPLAKGYVRVVPRPARNGVSNFFRNLRQPVVIVNSVLQGDGTRAWQALGRFLLNSTVGLGGVFDPASHEGFPEPREDFGQTLGRWGWRQSRYLELPFFGPSTLRDSLGMVADYPLNPTNRLGDGNARWALRGLRTINTRALLLPSDALREGAADDYTLIRDAWLQQRSYQIEKDRHPDASVLPDYLQVPPADLPADAPAGTP